MLLGTWRQEPENKSGDLFRPPLVVSPLSAFSVAKAGTVSVREQSLYYCRVKLR